jgi:aspartyl/asparaginyl beta-hydroxylase (cupin superfamily)
MFPRSSQKGKSCMIPKLTTPFITPITEFTLACDRLLSDPITRDALTKDELDILKTCVQRLTERFQLAA